MAVVEKTIIAGGGGDYTTIASWESATNLNSGNDIWKGVISDNSSYAEAVELATDGTSVNSYVWLTAASGNRHSGVQGTGHARINPGSSPGGHAVEISGDYGRVSWLQLNAGTKNSDEGVRVASGVTKALISYCIILGDHTTNSQDGIYTGNYSADYSVDNCIIAGFERHCIHVQQYQVTSRTLAVNVDHCTIFHGGDSPPVGVMHVRSEGSSDVIDLAVYNNAGARGGTAAFVDSETGTAGTTPAGAVTWDGSHNLRDTTDDLINGTDNLTNWQSATDGVEDTSQTTGSYVVVVNYVEGTTTGYNLKLLDDEAGNLAAGNGTNRQGSEPDSRQDFSVDITGSTRPTTGVDIGAHQVSSAGGTTYQDFGTAQVDLSTATVDSADVADTGTGQVDVTAATTDSNAGSDSGTGLVDLSTASTDTVSKVYFDSGVGAIDLSTDSADTAQFNESGTALTDLTTTSNDTNAGVDSGTGLVEFTTDSFDSVGSQYFDTGTGLIEVTAATTDSTAGSDTGAGLVEMTVATTDSQASNDTGVGLVEFTTSSADTFGASDTGTGTIDVSTGSADSASLSDTGIGLVEYTTTSADTTTFVDAGTGLVEFTTASTDDVAGDTTGTSDYDNLSDGTTIDWSPSTVINGRDFDTGFGTNPEADTGVAPPGADFDVSMLWGTGLVASASLGHDFGKDSDEMFTLFAFRVSALPSTEGTIAHLKNDADNAVRAEVRLTSSGEIRIRNVFTSHDITASAFVSVDTWYICLWEVKGNATTGYNRMRIYDDTGTLLDTLGDLTEDENTGGQIGVFRMGPISAPNGSATYHFSNLDFSTSAVPTMWRFSETYVDQGSATIDLSVATTDTNSSTESGTGVVDLSITSSDATAGSDSGTGLVEFTTDSTDTVGGAYYDSGAGLIDLSTATTDVATFTDTGTAFVNLVVSSTDQVSSGTGFFSTKFWELFGILTITQYLDTGVGAFTFTTTTTDTLYSSVVVPTEPPSIFPITDLPYIDPFLDPATATNASGRPSTVTATNRPPTID